MELFQNLVLEGDAFRVILREPRFHSILIGEYLDVVWVSDLLAGVDLAKYGHG